MVEGRTAFGDPRIMGFDGDGTLRFQRDKNLLVENPVIQTDLPKSVKLTLRPEVFVSNVQGSSFSVVQLRDWITQANACVRGYAGVFAILAPKVYNVEVTFKSQADSVRVVSSFGTTNLKPDVQTHAVMIDTYEMTFADDAVFQLSSIPIQIAPVVPASIEFSMKSDE